MATKLLSWRALFPLFSRLHSHRKILYQMKNRKKCPFLKAKISALCSLWIEVAQCAVSELISPNKHSLSLSSHCQQVVNSVLLASALILNSSKMAANRLLNIMTRQKQKPSHTCSKWMPILEVQIY